MGGGRKFSYVLVEILGQRRGIPRRNPMCSLRILLPQLLKSTTKLADFEHLSDIVSRYEAPSVITGHSVNVACVSGIVYNPHQIIYI